MGRTKSPINTELNADVPLSDDLNVSLNAMTQHRMEIMQQFGDGLPYERERIVHEARFIWRRVLNLCWKRVSG
ncbi:hypothetical protein MUTS16_35280 [Escherichia coli]|nr:hypothetical protein MUTS16_35280 [Escherichia coli]